ncbi:hypothetical protein BC827DRAFT_1266729 [Russula dissimulans]|nr:hypothetical protein BC827DRAFT_1266729 [Russula dissimulans]
MPPQDLGNPSQYHTAALLPRNTSGSRRLHARSELKVGARDPAPADLEIVSTPRGGRPLATSRPAPQSTKSFHVQVATSGTASLVVILIIVLVLLYFLRAKRKTSKSTEENKNVLAIELAPMPPPQPSQSTIGDSEPSIRGDEVQVDFEISSTRKPAPTQNNQSLTAPGSLQVSPFTTIEHPTVCASPPPSYYTSPTPMITGIDSPPAARRAPIRSPEAWNPTYSSPERLPITDIPSFPFPTSTYGPRAQAASRVPVQHPVHPSPYSLPPGTMPWANPSPRSWVYPQYDREQRSAGFYPSRTLH